MKHWKSSSNLKFFIPSLSFIFLMSNAWMVVSLVLSVMVTTILFVIHMNCHPVSSFILYSQALRHNLLLRAACNNRCPLPYNSTMHTHNSFGGSTACPGCSIPSDNNSNKVYLNPPDANDEIHVNVAPDSYVQRLRS
ncbi:unnamed protein product [Trichobilharzia regenti]|nr:unnamed protein product [Trichobilharzia regenti]